MISQKEFTSREFNEHYKNYILNLKFFESGNYYYVYKRRYRETLREFERLGLSKDASILEIGGGQIAILAKYMFGNRSTIWDLYDTYSVPFSKLGIGFAQFDILHDETVPNSEIFDAIVLCEVVEHLPIPLYLALQKLYVALKPGGKLLITTPNIFRVRNFVKLVVGNDIFSDWFIPDRGQSLGHVNEFSAERLSWQAARAGFKVISVEHKHLSFRGINLVNTIGKSLSLPLALRPRWREGLFMVCQRPEQN